jgi:hypothetical protein
MKRTTTATSTATGRRPGPLMYDCCRCGIGRTLVCLTCQRWLRHQRIVAARRAAWGAQP